MRLIQLPLHLSPEQALSVIEVLEQLQATLWNHYGETIETELRPINCEDGPEITGDDTPDFEDPIPF